MKKSSIILIFIFILLSSSIYGLNQTKFTNNLLTENISLTNANPKTRFINIPRYVNISNASINTKAYPLNTRSCYQEFSNITTDCDNPISWEYLYTTGGSENYIYINYSWPIGTDFSNTYIQAKFGTTPIRTNFSLLASCLKDPIQIVMASGQGVPVPNTFRLFCINTTNQWERIAASDEAATVSTSAVQPNPYFAFDGNWDTHVCTRTDGNWVTSVGNRSCDIWEEAMWWNLSSYPTNANIKIGTTNIFSDTGIYNDTNSTSFVTLLNAILPACACTGCTISGTDNIYCNVPTIFDSDYEGKIEYSNLFIEYDPIDSKITINIIDSNSLTTLTENTTIQLVGDSYQSENTTITGQSIFYNVTFNDSISQDLSIRAFSTKNTDYSLVKQEKIIYAGVNKVYNLYMTNTSDLDTTNLVKFHVQDENFDPLKGAVVTILKQDPATSQYLTLTEITTDTNGQATTILETDTIFYRFVVKFNGINIFSSLEPITISINDDDIYLIGAINPTFTEYYDGIKNTVTSLNFVNTTGQQTEGYFTMSFVSTGSIEACLEVIVVNRTNPQVYYNCVNGSSGDITSSTFTPNNITLYTAKALIDTNDGYGKRLKESLSAYIGQSGVTIDNQQGVFFIVIVILIGAFAFAKSPLAGLIFFIIGIIIILISKMLSSFTPALAMILISLAGISIYVVIKNR